MPAGKPVLDVPSPNVSVKIESPEPPEQKPNCPCVFKTEAHKMKNNNFIYLVTIQNELGTSHLIMSKSYIS